MTAQEFLDKAKGLRIAVIGDLIIDEYRVGTVDRISPEAPVPVLFQKEVLYSLGGAGNVYRNLEGLGVAVDLYCNCNMKIAELMLTQGDNNIYFNDYPGAHKIRMMAGNHHIMRVDVEQPSDQIEWLQYRDFSWWRDLIENFDKYDAIVLSDYGKGVLSDGVINTIIEFSKQSKKQIIADVKKDMRRYRAPNVLIKCNKKEWTDSRDDLVDRNYVRTDGENGITVQYGTINELIPAPKVDIVDVCGAGDTVTAVMAIGMGAGIYPFITAKFANQAASEVCRHPMVFAITQDLFLKQYEATR